MKLHLFSDITLGTLFQNFTID